MVSLFTRMETWCRLVLSQIPGGASFVSQSLRPLLESLHSGSDYQLAAGMPEPEGPGEGTCPPPLESSGRWENFCWLKNPTFEVMFFIVGNEYKIKVSIQFNVIIKKND